jgi:23S rRNA pseudouridine1911/1915/1917 synthase
LVNGLLYHCDNLSGINGVKRPGIVHRLDKDTSGALVVAKHDGAHNELARQFKNREVKKEYLALVEGQLKHKKGKIDAAIGRDPHNRKRMAVTSKNSKRAVSRFEVVERYKESTLVRVKLETGRTHQIRVHMEYMGNPVAGDELYGYGNLSVTPPRQILHAEVLGFYHPQSGDWEEFKAPLPADMEEAIDIEP